MKTCKHIILSLILSAVVIAASAPFAYAAPMYNDVTESHPAYDSIVKIAQKGILVSDAAGNYRPDDLIDKFETVKILASLSGYKQIDYTDTEKDFYDRSYEKNKSLISQYGKNFKKWNTSADREIAFLIEKEILTPEDLNQFVVLRNGEEAMRALSREEAMVYMVKIMNRKTQALSAVNLYEFADDLRIAAQYKPYVYYMKNTGLIKPDDENNFNPKKAVTRADMAVLLDSVISSMDNLDPDNRTETELRTDAPEVPTGPSVIESVSGVFDRAFESESGNGIQIIGYDGEKLLYKTTPAVIVYIDGFLKTVSDLSQGMRLVAVLNNLTVIEIKAESRLQTVSGAETGSPGTAEMPAGPVQLSVVEGSVLSVSTDSIAKTVTIEVRAINQNGQVITDIKSYAVQENCPITRGDAAQALSDIRMGDIIRAEVYGANVYSICLEEKYRSIEGKILQKKQKDNMYTLVVADTTGTVYELRIEDDAYITRGESPITRDMLRTGDSVSIRTEYDKIIDIKATGSRSYIIGTVESFRADRDGTFISVYAANALVEYPVVVQSADISLIYIGAKVKIILDSSEILSLTVLPDGAAKPSITGVITLKSNHSVTLRDTKGQIWDMRINSETAIINASTGELMTAADLSEGMLAYAYHKNNLASFITVIP